MTLLSLRKIADQVLSIDDGVSARRDVLSLPPLKSKSLRASVRLLHAVLRYAPQLRLHPEDDNLPSSVPWYLARVRMRRNRSRWGDARILNVGQVDVQSLISQSSGGEHSGRGHRRTQFFLEIAGNDERKAEVCRGDLATAECYVQLRRSPTDIGIFDIQYWFFYPYNAFGPGHEGDWEHCTARVDGNGNLHRFFYASHAGESDWVDSGGVSRDDGGHPIVYSADESHACYPTPGTHGRGALPDDETSEGGPEWSTWTAIRLIGSVGVPRQGQEWIRYTGHWGEIGAVVTSDILVTSGPYGPAFQAWWDDDDKGNSANG
jgi:hypothetical protein